MFHLQQLVDLENKIIQIVNEVGQFQLSHFRSIASDQIEDKGLNQLVSFVDKESEKTLLKQLTQCVPNAQFIGEENTSYHVSQSHWSWIVDPLDGTTNYLHGLPLFSISAALAYKNEPLIGVVHIPTLNETFHAVKNNGAFCNSEKIQCSSVNLLSQSIIATGFPYYEFNKIDSYLKLLYQCMKNTHGLRRMGSAAIDLAYVAAGRFDAFFEYGLNSWDVAAGALLIEEAGGKVSDFKMSRNHIFGKEIIGSNPLLFPEFSSLVSSFL